MRSLLLCAVVTLGVTEAASAEPPKPSPPAATGAPSAKTSPPAATSAPSASAKASAPAPSAKPSAGSEANANAARKYYEDGVAAAAAQDWQKAYLAFSDAWRLKQHWQIAINLGQAELKLSKNADAAEHIAFYLREATEQSPEEVKQARAWLSQAREKVGIYRLNVAPKGAQVYVDNRLVGTAPLDRETYVEGGWHMIEARSGDAKALRQVEAPLGQSIEVRLGAGVPEPPPLGETAAGGAKGLLGGVVTPRNAVIAGGTTLALVNLVLGIVTATEATSKGSDQDALCKESCPDSSAIRTQWLQLENDRVGLSNLSVAGFVIAGLSLGATITTVVLLDSKPKKAAPAPPSAPPPPAALRVSPTVGGILFSGSF